MAEAQRDRDVGPPTESIYTQRKTGPEEERGGQTNGRSLKSLSNVRDSGGDYVKISLYFYKTSSQRPAHVGQ